MNADELVNAPAPQGANTATQQKGTVGQNEALVPPKQRLDAHGRLHSAR